ncbi:MAG TPA: isoprenylcysteine carboxylmethyltransferase family protein [Anditalea sp.]|nr:isoprenylcysteine carboxylmethyltransferase family protein [Anditalea sp.]
MGLKEELEQQGIWLFKYRGILPIIVLFIGLGIYTHSLLYPTEPISEVIFTIDYYIYFCLFISLLGQAIRVYTVGYTPENTSGRNTEEQVADTLNTSGIYSTVRHPLYLGNFFMWLGPAMLTGNVWFVIAFCLFYWVYYERIMYAEEQFLTRKFTQTYVDWASQIPAFIPSKENFKAPKLNFSWKKVIKKEKNGFAAIFIIFAIFDVIGNLIVYNKELNGFLIGSCIVTSIIYLILKYMKNNTTLLNESGR